MKHFRSILLFCVALFSIAPAHAFPNYPYRRSFTGFSASAMTLYSIYKVDTRHSMPATARMGFGGNARLEMVFTRNFRILLGADVISQSCSFNTYYFAKNQSQIFDLDYHYQHSLRTWELHIPLMFRLAFTRNEDDVDNSVYGLCGWATKVHVAAHTNVTNLDDGQEVYNGKTRLDFENWFIGKKFGNELVAGIGLTHRFHHSPESVFFELIYRYGLSRYTYYGNPTGGLGSYNGDSTNSLLMKNASLSFGIGFRM